MSEVRQEVLEFVKKVKEDPDLRKKLSELAEGKEDEFAPKVIELAKELGFDITEADIGHYMDAADDEELEIDELDIVNGGCGGNEPYGPAITHWLRTKCFTGDSLIATPSGDKPIKDIKVGDEVFSLDETGAKRIAKVVDMVKPKEMPVVKAVFDNGKEWYTTSSQWFYCGGDDYAPIEDDAGKKAITLEGESTGLSGKEETGRTETVYDFVVEGLNVFFVNGIAAEGYSLS